MTALYKQAENVGHYDRTRVFGKTVKEKLEEPVHQLQIWIDQAKPAIKQASKDYTKRLKQRTHDIRKFMKSTANKVTKATRLGVARVQKKRTRQPATRAEMTTQARRRSIFEKGTGSTNSNTNNPT